MRPTISLLLCVLLLSACTFSIAAPPPTPTPPPQEFAELLYRALSLEAMTKDAFLMGVNGLEGGDFSDIDVMAMTLFAAWLLQSSYEALDREYPTIFHPYVDTGKQQHDLLLSVGKRWLHDQSLDAADAFEELGAIDANQTLKAYAEWLIDHGYSYDDVEMMDVRLRTDLEADIDAIPY